MQIVRIIFAIVVFYVLVSNVPQWFKLKKKIRNLTTEIHELKEDLQ